MTRREFELEPNPRHASHVRDLLAARDFATLAAMASERIGCEVDPSRLETQCDRFKIVGDWTWTNATYCHWVLCRAVESAASAFLSHGQPDIRFACELHCFAIWFHETPEQLERLRNENLEAREAEYARSKLTKKQSRRVRPIDRTAHNVAPFPGVDGGAA